MCSLIKCCYSMCQHRQPNALCSLETQRRKGWHPREQNGKVLSVVWTSWEGMKKQASLGLFQPSRPWPAFPFSESPNVAVEEGVWTISAVVKSLQSCLTLCDPIDVSPPGSPIPGILQARTLELVAISFSGAAYRLWQSCALEPYIPISSYKRLS